MAKSSNASAPKNLDLVDDWSSHPAVEWLAERKKIFLWVCLAFFVLLAAFSRYVSVKTQHAESDFFEAENAFAQFQKEGVNLQKSGDLAQLEAIMQRHPDIQPKYQGAMAQTLLIAGDIPQAQTFADAIFKRTQSDGLELYQHFSRTSLLIGAGQYGEALAQAEQLKAGLEQRGVQENPMLYAFNLIRLGFLYQQTGQTKQELQSWKEWQAQGEHSAAVRSANQVLQIGQASLNQYIDERKKALNE